MTVSRFSKADHLLVPVMVSGFEKLDPGAGYLALISLLDKVSVELGEFKRQLRVSGEVVCYGVGERVEAILGGKRVESVTATWGTEEVMEEVLHVKRLTFAEFTKAATGRSAQTTASSSAASSVPATGVLRASMAGEGGVIDMPPPLLSRSPFFVSVGGGVPKRSRGDHLF